MERNRGTFLQLVVLGSALSCFISSCGQQAATESAKESIVLPIAARDEKHSDSVSLVAFTKDGGMLASTGGDTVKTWDTMTGRNLGTFKLPAKSVGLSVGEPILAATSLEHKIDVWDWRRKEKLGSIEGTDSHFYQQIALTGDSKTIAAATLDGTIAVIDVDAGSETNNFSAGHKEILAVVLSPDGKKIATGSETIRVFDVATGKKLNTLDGHTAKVTTLSFSPDGKTLASGSIDSSVRLWDVDSATQKAKLDGHSDKVNSVAFNNDGTLVASGSDDGTIRIWGADGGARQTINSKAKVLSVAFNPRDGKTLASGRSDGNVEIWNVAGNSGLTKEQTADSRRIFTVSAEGESKGRSAEQ